MNSPFVKTALMGLVAAACSIVAAAYFPWPEAVVESDIVGKPLFETYDTSSVRTIRIMGYDTDRNEVDRILVRRKGQKWVIPSKKEYIANNVAQYTASANSLNERDVLDEVTENQQDYLEYGVIDPVDSQSAANPDAIGTKIVLEDRQSRTIGSLIVGKRVSDDPRETKHFVRIPGQPSVYICEFDPRAIVTDFRAWVSPNLFKLSSETQIDRLQIENYRLDPKDLDAPAQKSYRAELRVGNQRLDLAKMETAGGAGEWKAIPLTPEMAQQLQPINTQIVNIRFSNVQRKKVDVANMLAEQKKVDDASELKWLESYGFKPAGYAEESFQFDAVGGEVLLEFGDGVNVTMYVGNIAERADAKELQLSRYVMFVSGVDESKFPMPNKPEAVEDEEEAKKNEKAYLRLVEERKGKVQNARIRAADANQQYADWIYMVPENIVSNLRPDVDVSAGTTPTKSAGPSAGPLADAIKRAAGETPKDEGSDNK